MAAIVVPFRPAGKQRLAPSSAKERDALAQAMLEDVLAAAAPLGRVILATEGGGQGTAVAAALGPLAGPVLVVNADLPCATTRDLARLLAAAPALVAAADGTTNALALADARSFVPLYGPGSARRFAERLSARPLELPNLADDVDTLADLERVEGRVGPRTKIALDGVRVAS